VPEDDLLIGAVAAELNIESWRVRRLADRGLCPQPRRLGRYRVFSRSDIPAIREAADRAGYLNRADRPEAVA